MIARRDRDLEYSHSPIEWIANESEKNVAMSAVNLGLPVVLEAKYMSDRRFFTMISIQF